MPANGRKLDSWNSIKHYIWFGKRKEMFGTKTNTFSLVVSHKLMNKINHNRFSSILYEEYKNDIRLFIDEVKHLNLTNLPQPFLPIHGDCYGEVQPKIMFYGWETRGCRDLKEWIKNAEIEPEEIIYYNEDFYKHAFLKKWRNNFGNDFWGFNLKFLAKIHEIENWKDLYKDSAKYREINSSFVWANSDSIERFNVTAKKMNCEYSDWLTVKNASKRFDNFERLIRIYLPDIVIIEHWDIEEYSIHNNITYQEEKVIIENCLWYYEIENPKTKLFWIPHPRGHSARNIDSKKLINNIISLI